MAYINQTEKQAIMQVIKPLMKQYGLKGSLSIGNRSTIVLTIKSGKLDFIGNYLETLDAQPYNTGHIHRPTDSIQPNPYWFQTQYTGNVLEFLTKAFDALKGEEWYDKSDVQSDYFNIKHYCKITCGTWNTPYQLTV